MWLNVTKRKKTYTHNLVKNFVFSQKKLRSQFSFFPFKELSEKPGSCLKILIHAKTSHPRTSLTYKRCLHVDATSAKDVSETYITSFINLFRTKDGCLCDIQKASVEYA